MPIDARFSKQAFLEEYLRDSSSRVLVDALATEVQALLHVAVAVEMANIVEELRSLGHDLRHYEPLQPGLIALRDDLEKHSSYQCDLRLAVDTTISTGFRDTVDYDEKSFEGEFGGGDADYVSQ